MSSSNQGLSQTAAGDNASRESSLMYAPAVLCIYGGESAAAAAEAQAPAAAGPPALTSLLSYICSVVEYVWVAMYRLAALREKPEQLLSFFLISSVHLSTTGPSAQAWFATELAGTLTCAELVHKHQPSHYQQLLAKLMRVAEFQGQKQAGPAVQAQPQRSGQHLIAAAPVLISHAVDGLQQTCYSSI